MKTISYLLLTFLLNSVWQIALVVAFAAAGAWVLRNIGGPHRHLLWMAALALSLALPISTALRSGDVTRIEPRTDPQSVIVSMTNVDEPHLLTPISDPAPTPSSSIHVNFKLALVLIVIYGLFLTYRTVNLIAAWLRTRALLRGATPLAPGGIQVLIARCRDAMQVERVELLQSAAVQVPVAIGFYRARIVLPEELLTEGDEAALTAAIGHELAHISRCDYLLNLICELIFLPISFHPAAAFARRRIRQTRELRCDELVAERLIDSETYARSLVQLAGSASLLGRRSQVLTVGIADADILEVRIMSLLQKAKSNIRRNRLWLIAAALLLAAPCIGAAAFSLRLDLNTNAPQEPTTAQQNKEKEEQQAQERRKLELKQRLESDPQFRAEFQEREKRQKLELETRDLNRAALVRLAKISMDQAIQIATGQAPGKVLECSLQGEHWEAPGKLAKDGMVFYHVVITSGEDVNPTTTHVLVDATNGSVIKIAKEEPRKVELGAALKERREPLSGEPLNGKAITLPPAAYPEAAHAARVEGEVAVRVVIDEGGNVVGAEAISGPELLRASAVEAARSARFSPTRVEGNPVKVKGTLVYNFRLGEGPPETRILDDRDRPTRQK